MALQLVLANSSISLIVALVLLITLIVRFFAKYYLASRRPKNFPPGPPTAPFIGNLHQLPTAKTYLKFQELGMKYGPIIGLKLGPQNVVVLNSYQHVKALFDKKGSIYSSRPDNHIGNKIVCPNDTHILLLRYGEAWRKQRKIVQSLLNVNAVDNLLPIQNAEAAQTMFQLLQDPEGYYDHIRRYSTAVILASVFGQRGASFNSPKVKALYHAQDQFTKLLEQGATPPIDAFPFLKAVPEFLAPWKSHAKAIREEQRSLYFNLLNETREQIGKGTGPDCFIKSLLREQEKKEIDDEHIAYLGGILMEAGSDTTASTLLSFLLAMLAYPETLAKAQAEVDRECGTSRSPTSDDIRNLPYLNACMNETLRWRPVAAGGIPHMLTQDDTYKGYFLPKGTILFANTWAIHRDKAEFERPDDFIPERFLSNKFGTSNPVDELTDSHRRATYGFGAGRRVCPGQRLAENSLMVNMAKLAWGFDIAPGPGSIDVDINTAYSDGFLTSPKKFPVTFKPRSEEHKLVIANEYEAAKGFFAQFEQ